MSMQTWLDKYYPRPATDFDLECRRTQLDAVRHSILKWEGLLHENMLEHKVRWSVHNGIVDADHDLQFPEIFLIDSSTCALCKFNVYNCRGCPLAKVRGNVHCDDRLLDEELSPYRVKRSRPEVMVMWLKRAEEYVIEQNTRQYLGED